MTAIRLVFLALGAALGSLIPFGAVLLASEGFDVTMIGLLGAATATVAVVAAPVWGHLGDAVLGRRRVLQLSALGAAIALVAFGLAGLPLVVVLAWIAVSAMSSTIMPTTDAIAVNAVRGTGGSSFARLRLVLSLAFGSAAIATGFLYNATGYEPAPFLAAACFVVLVVASRLVPDLPREPGASASAGGRGGSVGEAFAVQPRLPIVLFTFGLGIVGLLAVFGYLPLRIQELGGTPSDVALAAGLESMAEVPGFIVAGWLAARIGLRALYLGSGLLMAACIGVLILLTSPSLMIGVRLLTGTAYAGLTVASVLALGVLLPPALQATGQGLNAMTGSLASIAVGLLASALYGAAGLSALFALTGTATLVAAGLGWFVLPGRVPVPDPLSVPAATPPGASSV